MLATHTQLTPSSTNTLDGITSAFFAALDRDGGPVFAVSLALVALVLGAALVAWLRREIRADRREQTALDARHQAATQVTRCDDRRQSVRVPAHVPMTLRRADARGHVAYEQCETLNISGDAVAFLSRSSPASGVPVDFTIDLGDRRPVPLRGVVHRVEAPCVRDAPALVVVKLGPLSPGEREHMARWVAHEEERRLVERSRGRLCTACGRPLAADRELVHPACAAARSEGHPAPVMAQRPRPRAHRRVLRDTSLRAAPVSVRRPN